MHGERHERLIQNLITNRPGCCSCLRPANSADGDVEGLLEIGSSEDEDARQQVLERRKVSGRVSLIA